MMPHRAVDVKPKRRFVTTFCNMGTWRSVEALGSCAQETGGDPPGVRAAMSLIQSAKARCRTPKGGRGKRCQSIASERAMRGRVRSRARDGCVIQKRCRLWMRLLKPKVSLCQQLFPRTVRLWEAPLARQRKNARICLPCSFAQRGAALVPSWVHYMEQILRSQERRYALCSPIRGTSSFST